MLAMVLLAVLSGIIQHAALRVTFFSLCGAETSLAETLRRRTSLRVSQNPPTIGSDAHAQRRQRHGAYGVPVTAADSALACYSEETQVVEPQDVRALPWPHASRSTTPAPAGQTHRNSTLPRSAGTSAAGPFPTPDQPFPGTHRQAGQYPASSAHPSKTAGVSSPQSSILITFHTGRWPYFQ